VQTLEKINQMLPLYIQKFKFIFAKNDFDILSEYCHWNHTIELTLETEPKSLEIYPLLLSEQIKLDTFFAGNLCICRIYPSKSPIATLVFFIKKKDDSL